MSTTAILTVGGARLMRRLAIVGLAIGLQAGAQADSKSAPKPAHKTAPKPAQQPSERFEENMMLRFHMHENFGVLRSLETLLIHGKIDEAHTLAEAIALAPDEPGAGAWTAQTLRVRESATALARMTSVDDALRETARLAAACGACHVDAGAQPDIATAKVPPPDLQTIPARMARHLWASDRLWEGMLGNTEPPWRAGLDVLAATPLPAAELGSDRVALGKQLQRLATETRAKAPLDLPARAAAYGDLLVTCASCHAKKPANEARR